MLPANLCSPSAVLPIFFLLIGALLLPANANQTATPSSDSLQKNGSAEKLVAPVPIFTKLPEYSPEAKEARIKGVVKLKFKVGKDGVPRDVEIVQGLGHGLDEKVIECVKAWRYRPAMRGSEPIESQTSLDLELSPENSENLGLPTMTNNPSSSTDLSEYRREPSKSREHVFHAAAAELGNLIAKSCGPGTLVTMKGNEVVCEDTRELATASGKERIRSTITFGLTEKGDDTIVSASYRLCSVRPSGLCVPLNVPEVKANEVLAKIFDGLQRKLNR